MGVPCPIGSVERALKTCEEERECVRAERNAFQSFAATVGALPVGSHQSAETPAGVTAPTGDRGQLGTVRDCYRETVMSVPDYDEEYGESLHENMTNEFGEEVATAVTGGAGFTPQLKQLLVGRAQIAARQRKALHGALDAEYGSVNDARTQLREIDASLDRLTVTDPRERSFSELVDDARDLRQGERRCEQLLETRQREIHGGTRQFRRSDSVLLQEYLNADLDVTFPVLDATLEQLRRFRKRRRAVIRTLARRE